MKRNEAKKRKKKIMLISTLATAALIVGGLTFAWYTSQDSVTNTFKTSGNLKTVVVENFTPPTNWQPGVVTDKVVQVTNTGTIDAYTRVKLDELLTYYKKGAEVALVEDASISKYDATNVPYVQVDAEAIEKTVDAWNSTHTEGNADGQYVEVKDLTEYGIDSSYQDKIKLWVKKASGLSKDSDGKQVENGTNYEFLGYYDTGLTESAVNNSTTTTADDDAETTTAKKKICYELNIVPTITDTQSETTVSTSAVQADSKTDVTHTLGVSLACSIYKAEKKTVSSDTNVNADENINKYIELEFNTGGTSDQSDWYYYNGYYYYRGILASGQSTTPLLKAVRMREDVSDDVINATYELTVISDSTQAVKEAFIGSWSLQDADYSKIITNLSKNPGTASNIVRPTTSNCEYDTTGSLKLACSIDLDDLIKTSRTHDAKAVEGARQTAPSTKTESASAVEGEEG